MPNFVAYYRVSTDRQGESGLGLEAQRASVARFTHGASLLSEFQEIESGKRHTNRPQLAAALDQCRRHKASVVIVVSESSASLAAPSIRKPGHRQILLVQTSTKHCNSLNPNER
jgi:hypothetical protein